MLASIGAKYTVCGMFHVNDVNVSVQVDTVRTPTEEELSIVITTVLPEGGGISRVTFVYAVPVAVTVT